MTRFLSLAVAIFAVACSNSEAPVDEPIEAPPRREAKEPTSDPAASADEQAQAEALPAAPADDGTAASRPAPSGTTIRDCGTKLTEAKPLRKTTLWTSTRTAALGASVVDSKAGSVMWATGTPTPPDFDGLESRGGAGPDETGIASILGHIDAPQLPATWTTLPIDNFMVHVSGKDPLEVFGAAVEPSMKRMTFANAWSQRGGAFRLVPEKRTADTPSDDTARYVRNFVPHRYVGFAFTVTVASDCAAGALADAVGSVPSVRQLNFAGGATKGTLLDPAKRDVIQSTLVRDGALLHLAVISNRPRAVMQKIVDDTTCSPTDLAACEAAIVALETESAKLSTEGALPAYALLAANQDPNWSVTRFDASQVVILGP